MGRGNEEREGRGRKRKERWKEVMRREPSHFKMP